MEYELIHIETVFGDETHQNIINMSLIFSNFIYFTKLTIKKQYI